MIDLHTHSILSDGELIPCELARRALVKGCKAIAITDHADYSNIEVVLKGLVKVAKEINKYWDITVLPGVEITHAPLEAFSDLVKIARKNGAKIVVGHGESPAEPVLPGTNRAAILAGVDILAHPGFMSEEDAELAREKGVYLELTARGGHSEGNKHVFDTATKTGANMVLCTDTHSPNDILTAERAAAVLDALTDSEEVKAAILNNSQVIVDSVS